MLIVIDAQASRDHLQIPDPPIARIPPHFLPGVYGPYLT